MDRLRRDAADCRACPLWKNATQTVFGEGCPRSSVMLVGEQPGDRRTSRAGLSSARPAEFWTARWPTRASTAGSST